MKDHFLTNGVCSIPLLFTNFNLFWYGFNAYMVLPKVSSVLFFARVLSMFLLLSPFGDVCSGILLGAFFWSFFDVAIC